MQNIFGYLLSIILFITVAQPSFAQSEQYAFRVHFKEKAETNFLLSNPLQYLSQRALDRRNKYNINIDSTDLPVVATYVDSVLNVTNGVLHLTSRWQNYCVILVEDSASILDLLDISFVKSVKKVAYYGQGLHERPSNGNDSTNSNTGNRPTAFDANFYAAAWTQIHMCDGEYLHEEGNMGEGMLISVIDVGFSEVDNISAFDSLFASGRLMDTWNFIYDTSHVFDYGGHGTAVLSSMAAYIPETFVGTAPKAMYALYATDHQDSEQAIEEDNFAAAVERADSMGTDIVNTSLGYSTFDNPDDSYTYNDLDGNSTLVAKAANAATRKGILMVVAAGNDGNNAWQHIVTPGDADSALTVGSVTASKSPSGFSGEGPNFAGVLKPNVATMGTQAAIISTSGGIDHTNGTSLAAPILTGLATCLMQEVPNLKPLEVRALIESVSHLHSNPNNKSGHGVPNFRLAFDLVTDINDIAQKEQLNFSIYPNPAKNDLFILSRAGNNSTVTCTVIDIQGRTLMENELKFGNSGAPQRLDITNLPSGIFILKLSDGHRMQIGKLVKE